MSVFVVGSVHAGWTVIGPVIRGRNRHDYVLVRCACGKEKSVRCSSILAGQSSSCANCAQDKGHKSHPLYDLWCGMLARCRNKNHSAYYNYGGRGIGVCERWLDFGNFRDDVGERPAGHTLDREDGNKDYSPDNCRWATYSLQAANKRKLAGVTSGFIGVHYRNGKWCAQFAQNNKKHYIGDFDDEVIAAIHRDCAVAHLGYPLNFPEACYGR